MAVILLREPGSTGSLEMVTEIPHWEWMEPIGTALESSFTGTALELDHLGRHVRAPIGTALEPELDGEHIGAPIVRALESKMSVTDWMTWRT